MLRTPPGCCPDCELPACRCHDKAYWRAVAEAEQQRRNEEQQRKAEADRIAAIETAPVDVPVLLQRTALPVEDGLLLEGIATTRYWDESASRRGRLPRKMVRSLPVPLLWLHKWDKRIGTMFEASATEDVLYFSAIVAPPGTDGYDANLLRRVWDDIRSEAVRAVSFAAKNVKVDGGWEPSELSVCPEGANPCATITRAVFPGDCVMGYSPVPFDPDLVRRATAEHQARAKRIREQANALQRVTQTRAAGNSDGVPLRTYRFVWKQGETYARGDVVTDRGSAWLCLEPGPDRPGYSGAWRLVSKRDLPERSEAAA